MAPQRNKKNNNETSGRTAIIAVAVFLIVAVLVGNQYQGLMTNGADQRTTDTLITSEFLQAVEQDRVESVVYDAGSYTVTGTYYPAATAGSAALNAFNSAFNTMNAAVSQYKSDAGRGLTGIATSSLDGANLGELHNYTTTYVGQESLAQLVAKHPQTSYQVKLPSQWTEVLGTILPILIIGALLYFFFTQMQRANNQQMGFGKTKAK